MANLTREYTDVKEIKHTVEHLILSPDAQNNKEQLIEELFHALTGPRKHLQHCTRNC